MNNVGLAAHRLERPARPRLPKRAPCPGSSMLAAGPDASSCPDNGSAYVSHAHRAACDQLGLRHHRIKPGRPRTNGKAERFIRTMLGAWAYGAIYGSSTERAAALPHWLNHYNYRRPHSSLGHQPPATRINNLPGSYT